MQDKILTLTGALEKVAKERSQKTCMQHKKGKDSLCYGYDQLLDESFKIANWLLSKGIKKGDRVALMLENSPQWGVCYFGILFSGAIAVPIDIQSGHDDLEYILKDSHCKVIFTSSAISCFEVLEKNSHLEEIVLMEEGQSKDNIHSYRQVLMNVSQEKTLPALDIDDIASIIYTSGTTGPFKGVMLTHKNFYSNFLSVERFNIVRANDNMLSILPLHHSYAFLVTLIVPLFCGAMITYIDTLRSEEIIKVLQEENITIMVVVPQIMKVFYKKIKENLERRNLYFRVYLNLIKEILWAIRCITKLNLSKLVFSKIHSRLGSNLRFFVCGGAKLDEEICRFFFKLGFKIIEGYGLTETSPVVSLNPPSNLKIGSVGKSLTSVQVKIDNPDNTGIGQIIIKGPNVMRGYYHRRDETEAVLKNGWFYSGDLGYLDKGGYLYIKGRLKETIILSSGKNISPEEVESHYLKSLFIKEMCVLFDEKEDKLVAIVLPNLAYFKKVRESNVYDIVKWNLEYLSAKLPPYKRIRGFVLVSEDLPHTRLGKIKRFKASQIYRESLDKKIPKKAIEKTLPSGLSPVAKEVLAILKKEKKLKEIYLTDHLELDLGIDSLEKIEILLALEKEFNVAIKEEDLAKVFTVKELLDYIEQITIEKKFIKGKEPIAWGNILSSPPQDFLREKIELTPKVRSKLLTFGGGISLDLLFRVFFSLRVYGKSNLPQERFMLCPNHTSYLDAFIIFSALPLRLKHSTFFIGLSKYFVVPIIRDFVKYLKVIPIDFSSNLVETMKAASFVLRNKKTLCVFPEGVRSVDGHLKEFKKGVGILAKELDIEIVPVCIKGAHGAWRPGVVMPKPYPVKVIFGKALSAAQLRDRGKALKQDIDDYQAISLGLKQEVTNLAKTHP